MIESPTRVIVDGEGYALPPELAAYQHIYPDIVFMRDDGWSLGAPNEYESVAFHLWENSWVKFIRKGDEDWTDISNY